MTSILCGVEDIKQQMNKTKNKQKLIKYFLIKKYDSQTIEQNIEQNKAGTKKYTS